MNEVLTEVPRTCSPTIPEMLLFSTLAMNYCDCASSVVPQTICAYRGVALLKTGGQIDPDWFLDNATYPLAKISPDTSHGVAYWTCLPGLKGREQEAGP